MRLRVIALDCINQLGTNQLSSYISLMRGTFLDYFLLARARAWRDSWSKDSVMFARQLYKQACDNAQFLSEISVLRCL